MTTTTLDTFTPTVPVLPDALERVIDRLVNDARAFNAPAWEAYKARLREVIALDPARLEGGYGHPVTDMDEAAVALFVAAWAGGLRRGVALGLSAGT